MRISDWSSDVCSSDLDRASGRNLAAGFTLNTVGEAVGYFQSRRRHFVSLLYLMADACKGTKKLEPEHAFDVLLPVVEYCCKIGRASCREECVSTCRFRWSPDH